MPQQYIIYYYYAYVHTVTTIIVCALIYNNIVFTDIILSLNVSDDLKSVEQILRLYQNILFRDYNTMTYLSDVVLLLILPIPSSSWSLLGCTYSESCPKLQN